MRFTRNVLNDKLPRLFLLALATLLAISAPALINAPVQAQTFSQPKVIPTGNWPAAVYSADVNADGYPDLIYIDQGATPGQPSTTHILLNDGKGNFSQSATIATVGNSLAIGNLAGAGHVDLGWVDVDTTVAGAPYPTLTAHIAPNSGGGTFGATQKIPLFTYSGSTKIGFTTAAHAYATGPDLIVCEDLTFQNGFVLHLLNGAFAGNTTLLLPDGPGPVTIADLNGDGVNDLIIEGTTGSPLGPTPPSAQIFLASGLDFGSFHAPNSRFTGATGVQSLLIKDVNLDGRPDLIAEGANGHIDVYFGNGDGTFQTTSSGGTGTLNGLTGNGGHLIATGDFNHDGQLDALTATPIGISALLGQGTQYLGLKGIYNAGPGHTSYALADFNNDGNPDLAVDSPEGIAILYGNKDGSFQTSQAYAAGQPAMSGALAKFTTSGHLDAIVSTSATQAQLLLGQGNGSFLAQSTLLGVANTSSASLWSHVAVGDLDSDGNLDIAITADGSASAIAAATPATTSGGTTYLYGQGTGTFSSEPFAGENDSRGAGVYYGVSVAGPGLGLQERQGLVILDPNHLWQVSNNTGGIGPDATSIARAADAHAHNLIAAGSFNSTGLSDLIAQDQSSLKLYPNNGYSLFSAPLGDLSVDGSLTTPGQITAPNISTTFNQPYFPGAMATADLDKDGNTDLLVTYANLSANLQAPNSSLPNYLYIWYGSGSGQFLTSAKHPVNPVVLTPSRNFYQIAIADMNGDSIPDLILSDGYILSVQLGKGDGTFGAETHYLAGQGINSMSTGDLRNSGHTDLVLANGGAVLTNPVANLEKLATNPDVNTGGVTVLLNQATALLIPPYNLTASPEPSTYGSSFTITASFPLGTGSTSPYPTGTVTFLVDAVQVGVGTINSSGIATVTYAAPNTLPVGNHSLTATYSGDSVYQSIQLIGTHSVVANPYTVTASPEPSVYGNTFEITATAPGPGAYQFFVDGTSVGTVNGTGNTASIFAPGTFASGTHTLTVDWAALNSTATAIITGTHVITTSATTISLVLCVDNPGSLFPCATPIGNTPLISPITFFYGQSLDGVATESASNLSGNINFYDGTRIFCTLTANLTGGSNVCPTQSGYFNAGSRTVYATYTGDPNNNASTSNSIAVTVFPDITTGKIASSLNPAVVGSSVTFTAVISGNYSIPNGSVNFYDGATLLGGASLDPSGTATFTTSTLAVGSHPISVVYMGNANFNPIPITAVLLTQVITAVVVPPPPSTGTGYTLTVTPDPVTIGAGATGALLVRITAQSTFTPPIALTCSGLPTETSCNFVTPTIPAGGGSTTLQFHVSAPHDCGTTTPYFIGSTDGPASPVPYTFAAAVFGAFAIFKRRRRSVGSKRSAWPDLFLVLVALASLASLSGCGHCTDLGTRPGNYTFTVIATPQGASTTTAQSVTVPLTVTIP